MWVFLEFNRVKDLAADCRRPRRGNRGMSTREMQIPSVAFVGKNKSKLAM